MSYPSGPHFAFSSASTPISAECDWYLTPVSLAPSCLLGDIAYFLACTA